MNSVTQPIMDMLQSSGIRPSYQRVRVLQYLREKGGHPSVDEIYQFLAPEIPSLSKTTIYNTLHLFVEAGLVRMIHIEDNEIRYDLTRSDHGHFICDQCGAITNFPVTYDRIVPGELNQFQIKERNIYFRGICPNCLNL